MEEIRRVEEANKQVQQAYLVYLRKMVAVAFDEATPREQKEKALQILANAYVLARIRNEKALFDFFEKEVGFPFLSQEVGPGVQLHMLGTSVMQIRRLLESEFTRRVLIEKVGKAQAISPLWNDVHETSEALKAHVDKLRVVFEMLLEGALAANLNNLIEITSELPEAELAIMLRHSFMWACQMGQLNVLKFLLEKQGAKFLDQKVPVKTKVRTWVKKVVGEDEFQEEIEVEVEKEVEEIKTLREIGMSQARNTDIKKLLSGEEVTELEKVGPAELQRELDEVGEKTLSAFIQFSDAVDKFGVELKKSPVTPGIIEVAQSIGAMKSMYTIEPVVKQPAEAKTSQAAVDVSDNPAPVVNVNNNNNVASAPPVPEKVSVQPSKDKGDAVAAPAVSLEPVPPKVAVPPKEDNVETDAAPAATSEPAAASSVGAHQEGVVSGSQARLIPQPAPTSAPSKPGLSLNAQKVIALFNNNSDPFSFRIGNGLGKIFRAHAEMKKIPMPQIVEAINAEPKLAAAFFKRRFFAWLPGRYNFRKELAGNHDLLKILMRSDDPRISAELDKFLGSTPGVLGTRYLSSAERAELRGAKTIIVLDKREEATKKAAAVLVSAPTEDLRSKFQSWLDNKDMIITDAMMQEVQSFMSHTMLTNQSEWSNLNRTLYLPLVSKAAAQQRAAASSSSIGDTQQSSASPSSSPRESTNSESVANDNNAATSRSGATAGHTSDANLRRLAEELLTTTQGEVGAKELAQSLHKVVGSSAPKPEQQPAPAADKAPAENKSPAEEEIRTKSSLRSARGRSGGGV